MSASDTGDSLDRFLTANKHYFRVTEKWKKIRMVKFSQTNSKENMERCVNILQKRRETGSDVSNVHYLWRSEASRMFAKKSRQCDRKITSKVSPSVTFPMGNGK